MEPAAVPFEPAYVKSSLSGLGDGSGAPSDQLLTISEPPGLCLNPQPSARKAAEDQSTADSEEEDEDEGADVDVQHHHGEDLYQQGMPVGGWNGWHQYPHEAHSMGLYNGFGPSQCWPYPYGWPSMYLGNGVPPLAPPDLSGFDGMGGAGCVGFEGWHAEAPLQVEEPLAAPGFPPPPSAPPPLVSPLLTSHPIDADVPAPPPGIPEVAALDVRPPPPEPPPGIPVVPGALEVSAFDSRPPPPEAPPGMPVMPAAFEAPTAPPPPPLAPPPLPPPPPPTAAGDVVPRADLFRDLGVEVASSAIHDPFISDGMRLGGAAPGLQPLELGRAISMPQPPPATDLTRAISFPEDSVFSSSLAPPSLSRAKSSPAGPLPPQPPTITQSAGEDGRSFRTQWTVDARKLKVKDKVAVSPSFQLGAKVPGTFRMMLYPTAVSERKGGASFKKAKGKGSVHVKCESPLGEVYDGNVTLTMLVCSSQDDASQQEENARGPLKHNFAESGICSLPKEQEEWDFGKATDEETQNFVVLLDILDPIFDGVA